MRIIQYKTMLDEDMKNILVRESSKNYPGLGRLDSPDNVCLLVNSVFSANRIAEEHSWLIAVNIKNHPIGVFDVSHGSDCAAVVTPRELFIRLLLCCAHAFFLIHNHPSGDITPSSEDDKLTKGIISAGKMLNVELIDHVIIADRMYYSYRESRRSWFYRRENRNHETETLCNNCNTYHGGRNSYIRTGAGQGKGNEAADSLC